MAVAGQPARQLDRPRFDAGMALGAVQAQAGHCSIESTRIWLMPGALPGAAQDLIHASRGQRTSPARASVAGRFFITLAAYLECERPAGTATETVYVVLKGVVLGSCPCRALIAAARASRAEGFKTWLAARPGYRGSRSPAATTIGMRLRPPALLLRPDHRMGLPQRPRPQPRLLRRQPDPRQARLPHAV